MVARTSSRRSLSFAVTLSLTAGLLGVITNAPARAAEASDPVQRPDRVAAIVTAKVSGKRVEILSERTENSNTYANPDGTFDAEVFAGPIRIKSSSGWRDIDPTLSDDGSAVVPAATAAKMRFSRGGTSETTRFTSGSRWISSTLSDITLPAPTIVGSVATYTDVLPGVDLVLEALSVGFKERLVIKTRPTSPLRLTFDLSVKGVAVQKQVDGRLTFTGTDGNVVAVTDTPLMWGAQTNPTSLEPTRVAPVATTLKTVRGAPVLEVAPDQAFLSDPTVQLPITIDPTQNLTGPTDTFVHKSYPTTSFYSDTDLRVGTYDGGSAVARTLMKFSLPSNLLGQEILYSRVWLWEWHSSSCTPTKFYMYRLTSGFSSSTTWNNQPGIASGAIASATYAKGYSSSCPDGLVDIGGSTLNGVVQDWADGALTNYGIELKAADETDSLSWKRFNSANDTSDKPYLAITYRSYPNTPSAANVPTGTAATTSSPGTWVNSLTPALSAVVSDPDGGSLRAAVSVQSSSGATTYYTDRYTESTAVSTGLRSTFMPPAALAGGQANYRWRVRAWDGSNLSKGYAPSSGWYYFRTDVTAPVVPTVSSSTYPQDLWSADKTVPGTFSWSSTDALSGIATYAYGFDNSNPTNWGTATSTTWTPTANGPHTLTVKAKDAAGNIATQSYNFGVGDASLTLPAEGHRFQKRLTLQAQGPSTITGATLQFRRADTEDAWADMPVGTQAQGGKVTRADDGTYVTAWPVTVSGGIAPKLVWDAPNTSQINHQDGPLEVRAKLASTSGTSYTDAVRVKLDEKALGGDYASSGVGPGSVNLVTGNFNLGATDVSIASYGSDLTIGRTFNSSDAFVSGPFGLGWAPSFSVDEAASDFAGLREIITTTPKQDFVVLDTAEGEQIGFSHVGTEYLPEEGAEDLSLIKQNGEFHLTDLDGNDTVFTLPATTPPGTSYVVDRVIQPGSANTTTYLNEVANNVSRLKRIIAPHPSGITCTASDPTTLPAGCRALDILYASTTTAIGTTLGDIQGKVQEIKFTALDPGVSAVRTVSVAKYRYDATGHLREAWDPRITPALTNTYTYDTNNGHVLTQTPAGELGWTFAYVSGTDKLLSASRPTLPSGTATTTVVYGVPLSGTGAPHDMSAGAVADWGQSDLPDAAAGENPGTNATAIVPPDGNVTTLDRATVFYFNHEGRQVNVASPGGYIATTEYDLHSNVVRELTAANRAQALATGSTSAEHAARAQELDTERIYSEDGLELLEESGPLHQVTLADGTLVDAREHTLNSYDETAPRDTNGDLIEAFHLVTTSRVGAKIAGQTQDADVRTSTTDYDWTLRQPVISTTDPAGLNLISKTFYDAATGLVTETRMPGGPAGGTAHSTRTIYYRAGSYTEYSDCGGHPEWENLVCKTLPAAQPATSGQPDLPVVTLTYSMLNQVSQKIETVGTDQRTTTIVYDEAGRKVSESLSSTIAEPIPTVHYDYDTTSGRQTRTWTADAEILRTFDTLGRLTTYTDASGNVSTTTYDTLDRPITTTDGKGSQTRSYDGGSERRGLVTGITDSTGLSFTATYDADGRQSTRTYPNGLAATTTYDEIGIETALEYGQTQGCTEDCSWLSFSVSESIHGQWRTQGSTLSSQDYSYDGAGRLSAVKDTPNADGCTTRQYWYDADSNRTRQSIWDPAGDGTCQSATGEVRIDRGYDAADRLIGTGYDYDAFGRTQGVPATDTGGNAIAATYYANDLVRTLSQNGVSRTWSLDPSGRFLGWSDTAGVIKSNRYSGDADSAAWIAENATATEWTRNIGGIDGDLSAIEDQAGTVRLQLTNLHGDIVATAGPDVTPPVEEAGLLSTLESTEFGVPRDGTSPRFGWLGAKHRNVDSLTGIVLMGVRLYVPGLGRFLQVDPVPGGGANAYDYARQDPLNTFDLDGRFGWKKFFKRVLRVAVAAATVASMFSCPVCTAIGYGLAAYSAYNGYRAYQRRDWGGVAWAAADVFGVGLGRMASKAGRVTRFLEGRASTVRSVRKAAMYAGKAARWRSRYALYRTGSIAPSVIQLSRWE
jgi:RHS repeat-associated protein